MHSNLALGVRDRSLEPQFPENGCQMGVKATKRPLLSGTAVRNLNLIGGEPPGTRTQNRLIKSQSHRAPDAFRQHSQPFATVRLNSISRPRQLTDGLLSRPGSP